MNKEQFVEELKKINININNDILKKLEKYCEILLNENKKYNLTSITEENQVYLKHFYDSLTIVKGIELKNQYICDIGSGAGFPGLVLKIVFPNIRIDLLDATTKKCNFLKLVIETLHLENIKVINERAEKYSHETSEKYDIIVSRAVAPLKHLLEYSIPLLKIDGIFIALKSNLDEELNNIDNYYNKLYLTNEKIIRFNLPYEDSHRSIYMINKYNRTPSIYPREYNQIKKKEI